MSYVLQSRVSTVLSISLCKEFHDSHIAEMIFIMLIMLLSVVIFKKWKCIPILSHSYND